MPSAAMRNHASPRRATPRPCVSIRIPKRNSALPVNDQIPVILTSEKRPRISVGGRLPNRFAPVVDHQISVILHFATVGAHSSRATSPNHARIRPLSYIRRQRTIVDAIQHQVAVRLHDELKRSRSGKKNVSQIKLPLGPMEWIRIRQLTARRHKIPERLHNLTPSFGIFRTIHPAAHVRKLPAAPPFRADGSLT
jgi:hypothetical protein